MPQGTTFNILWWAIMQKNICMCISHFAVQQRSAQHCKSTTLQLKTENCNLLWEVTCLPATNYPKAPYYPQSGFSTIYDWCNFPNWRRKWQPTLVFLPGESHGQRSLTGYSPWGHKQLDMTEQACNFPKGNQFCRSWIIPNSKWAYGSEGMRHDYTYVFIVF